MTVRRDLPGGWIELRTADEVPERAARRLDRARRAALARAAELEEAGWGTDTTTLAMVDIGTEDRTVFEAYEDCLIEELVTAWSWETPTSEAAGLPRRIYAAVIAECSEVRNQLDLDMTADGAFTDEGEANPLAPIGSSNGSEQPAPGA